MTRRSLFRLTLGALVAPFVAPILPTRKIAPIGATTEDILALTQLIWTPAIEQQSQDALMWSIFTREDAAYLHTGASEASAQREID